MLELVQSAAERKAPAELFIRKFARIYTPVVTALAVLIVLLPLLYSLVVPEFTFIFNDWLYRALVFLVILPLRLGSKHSAGLLRRNRSRIPTGYSIQRRKLLGCHY